MERPRPDRGQTPRSGQSAPASSTRPPKLCTLAMTPSSARLDGDQPSTLSVFRRSTRSRARLRRSHRSAASDGGEPAAGVASWCGPGAAWCGGSGRKPNFAIRAYTVFRAIPSFAAACEMFPPISSSAVSSSSRIASSRPVQVPVRGAGLEPSSCACSELRLSAVTAAVSVNTAARSIAFPSSRMFPGHSYVRSRAWASASSRLGASPYSAQARARNRSASSRTSRPRARRGGRSSVSTARRW